MFAGRNKIIDGKGATETMTVHWCTPHRQSDIEAINAAPFLLAEREAHLSDFLNRLYYSDLGQDGAEYALVIGLVSLAIIVGAMALGSSVNGWFNSISAFVTAHGIPT